MGLPSVARYPEATVSRDDEHLTIHFGGLEDEQTMSVRLKYVGAEDEEAAELRLLDQLQRRALFDEAGEDLAREGRQSYASRGLRVRLAPELEHR